MSGFAENLSPAESELWNSILLEAVSRTMKTAPGTPIPVTYSEAWNEFQRMKWTLDVDKNKGLNAEEYKAMDAGPDLSAVGRVRFPTGKKSKKSHKTGSVSAYSLFVREMCNEHREAWAELDSKQKIKAVAAIWHQMSDEEKAAFKAKHAQ